MGGSVLSRLPRGRNWLAIAAVILVALSLLPPAGSLARRYVFAESLQFVLFAALTWLKDTSDPDDELRAMIRAQRQQRGYRWSRPPRGWDPPSP